MKVVRFPREAGEAPSFADAYAELALTMERVSREGGRSVIGYLDEILTTEEVARELKIEPQSLRRWACAGCGPRRLRLGGPVRYRRADVLRWLEERTVEPTRPGPRRRRQNTTRHQAAASLEAAS